jgi:hypothetical protein
VEKVKKEEKDTQQVQQNQGWFGSWWSSSKKPDSDASGASDISIFRIVVNGQRIRFETSFIIYRHRETI